MKRLNLKLLALVALVGITLNPATSQQDAMYTHYMFNTLSVNPAYAGSRDALTVTGLNRIQWASFEGAPVTQTLTVHSPFFSDRLGIGLSVVNDRIGPTKSTAAFADFAYRIPVTEKGTLALGIKGGVNRMSNSLGMLDVGDQTDPSFVSQEGKLLPNVGFGIYYYSDHFYLGGGVPKLIENDFAANTISAGSNLASEERHYFLIGGAVLNLSSAVKLKPTTFFKVTPNAPMELDVTGTLIFRDRIWTGVMFRSADAIGALAGFNVTDQLSIGYSFDFSYGNLTGRYNGGSHELMVRYDFFYRNKGKVRSPRYF